MMLPRKKGIGQTSSLVGQIAAAIKREEGWAPGSVSYRNNNPGNLRPLGSGQWAGQVGVDSKGYVIFDSVVNGEAALEHQIQTNINRGLTLQQFFAGLPGVYAGYAPAGDANQPSAYAQNVSNWTGIPLDVPLNQLGSSVIPLTAPPSTPADTTDQSSADTTDTSGDGSDGSSGTPGGTSGGMTTDAMVIVGAIAIGIGAWAFFKG